MILIIIITLTYYCYSFTFTVTVFVIIYTQLLYVKLKVSFIYPSATNFPPSLYYIIIILDSPTICIHSTPPHPPLANNL